MIRFLNPEEKELFKRLNSPECSEEEKEAIIERLNEIDKEERGPFG